LRELVHDTRAAGLELHQASRSGFMPDFMPTWLYGFWRLIERGVELTPGVNVLAAHNVVVARKP
jgi:hypothetical protein